MMNMKDDISSKKSPAGLMTGWGCYDMAAKSFSDKN